jgi:hypothetical protein
MAQKGNAKLESFSSYPWLDYDKHQNTWLPIVGAGKNAKEQHCILTSVDDSVYRAIITKEMYDVVMAHSGSPPLNQILVR